MTDVIAGSRTSHGVRRPGDGDIRHAGGGILVGVTGRPVTRWTRQQQPSAPGLNLRPPANRVSRRAIALLDAARHRDLGGPGGASRCVIFFIGVHPTAPGPLGRRRGERRAGGSPTSSSCLAGASPCTAGRPRRPRRTPRPAGSRMERRIAPISRIQTVDSHRGSARAAAQARQRDDHDRLGSRPAEDPRARPGRQPSGWWTS